MRPVDIIMEAIDSSLIAELRRNGRATVSELAASLGVARATVKTHMDRLVKNGDIVGFTVVTDKEPETAALTGLITIALEGAAIERVVSQLRSHREITSIRTTHGVWDIIAEFGVPTVVDLDVVLAMIREQNGVMRTETSIYLRTRL